MKLFANNNILYQKKFNNIFEMFDGEVDTVTEHENVT